MYRIFMIALSIAVPCAGQISNPPSSFSPTQLAVISTEMPKEALKPTDPTIVSLINGVGKKVDEALRDKGGYEMLTDFLLPSKEERWANIANGGYFTATQQPGTVLVQQPDGTLQQKANPDQWLYQATANQNYSGLFWSTGDIQLAVSAFGSAVSSTGAAPKSGEIPKGLVKDGPCSSDQVEQNVLCLRQASKKDRFARILSSFTGSVTYNRTAQIISNLPAPNQSRLNQLTGEVVFTPSKLFVSADDWKNAESVTEFYGDDFESELATQVARRCYGTATAPRLTTTGESAACVRWIAGNKGFAEKVLSLLPAVDVKIQTQADFVKAGGILVQATYPQPVLMTIKATTDLSRFIPSAKDRATAFAFLEKVRTRKAQRELAQVHRDALTKFQTELSELKSNGSNPVGKDFVKDMLAAIEALP